MKQYLLKLDAEKALAQTEEIVKTLTSLFQTDKVQRISNDQIYLIELSAENLLFQKLNESKKILTENIKEYLKSIAGTEKSKYLVGNIEHFEINPILYIEPIKITAERSSIDKLWGQRQIRFPEAKKILPRRPKPEMPIGIATIDTGISFNHPALEDIIWKSPHKFSVQIENQNFDFAEGSFGFNVFDLYDEDKRGHPSDSHYHGTIVAGIIGAKDIGITRIDEKYFPIQLLAIKAFASGSSHSTDPVTEGHRIIQALDFIVEARKALKKMRNPIDLRIVNMSFGYYRRDYPRFSDILEKHIKKTSEEGILFVSGAGNNRKDLDVTINDKDWEFYPAGIDCDGMIAVAAIERSGCLWIESNYGKENVHIAAPGDSIYSTAFNDYTFGSGTSLAAPFVTASAALSLLAEPALGNREIKTRLIETADKIPPLGVQSDGSLDIYKFIYTYAK
jgi:hypothetical protein